MQVPLLIVYHYQVQKHTVKSDQLDHGVELGYCVSRHQAYSHLPATRESRRIPFTRQGKQVQQDQLVARAVGTALLFVEVLNLSFDSIIESGYLGSAETNHCSPRLHCYTDNQSPDNYHYLRAGRLAPCHQRESYH